MSFRNALAASWELLRATFEQWTEDNASHHAAALTFYTLFSLAPLLVIAVAIAGLFVGEQTIQAQILSWVRRYINSEDVATLVRNILENVSSPGSSLFATALSLFGLFFGATAIFSELRNTLNFIWDVPSQQDNGIRHLILNRLFALLMVIASGFVLISSFLLNITLSATAEWVTLLPLGWGNLGPVISFVFLFILTTLIFALIYKFVPDRSIAWGDIWTGALATALLFSIGRYLISLYMRYSTIASAYGAAGSLAILLLWTYYSAQVFFLGAEFTQVYTRTYGTRWVEKDLLDEAPDEADSYRGEIEGSKKPPPEHEQKPRYALVRATAQVGLAVGVIGVVSLISLIREPFRK